MGNSFPFRTVATGGFRGAVRPLNQYTERPTREAGEGPLCILALLYSSIDLGGDLSNTVVSVGMGNSPDHSPKRRADGQP
jgi:hypothetical protein